MATKSILKSIVIKDNESAKQLANALEQAGKKEVHDDQMIVSYSYASGKEIRKMFDIASK